MILPVDEGNDDLLYWQKQRIKQNKKDQSLDQQAQIQDSATVALKPKKNYKESVNLIEGIGDAANKAVSGSLKTQQEQAEQKRRDLFEKQQKEAIQDIEEGYRDQLTNLRQEYKEQYHQRWAEQQKQWNQYENNQSALWDEGIYTKIDNFSGKPVQIAQLARNAGFPESAIPMAVSVALAESSGRAEAVNHGNSNGTSDYGLMQINTVHEDLLSSSNWADPQDNMNMAYQIWKNAGGNWSPWVTYDTGAVDQYIAIGKKAAHAPQPVQMNPYMVQTARGLRRAIVSRAKQYIGVPYVWGGEDLSKGVDCSGLVQSVYEQFGIQLPRTARQQATEGVKTSISNLLPGDLVAWAPSLHDNGRTYVGHIAIYAGNGNIIEAQQSGVPVHVRPLTKHDNVFGVHLTNVVRDAQGNLQ